MVEYGWYVCGWDDNITVDYSVLSERIDVKGGLLTWKCTNHQCCHLSYLLFFFYVFMELTRSGVLNETLYADNLVLMNETIDQPKSMF